MLHRLELPTPLGPLTLVEEEEALIAVDFRPVHPDAPLAETPLLKQAARELQAYFAGRLKAFDLPLRPAGTDFYRQVWQQEALIPYGEVRTYQQVAEAVGHPRACRAVGTANRRNPISILIPCHRIVAKSGSLAGYAGGIDKKIYLLALEEAHR